MWPGSALFLNVHYCQVELEINAVGFHFFRGAFFFFSCASRGHCDHLNDVGAYFGFRCPSHLLPFALKSIYIIVGKKKMWTALQPKPRTTAPRILSQRRFDVVTLFMFHVAKPKWLLAHYFWRKKKAKVSALVTLRTNQGVFQLEQRSMPCFSCVFSCLLHFVLKLALRRFFPVLSIRAQDMSFSPNVAPLSSVTRASIPVLTTPLKLTQTGWSRPLPLLQALKSSINTF